AAVLLVAHNLAVGGIRLHVIERGDSYGRVAKGGVTGNVADPLAADIHDAPVTQRFQVLLACAQHRLLLVSSQNSSMSEPSRNRPVLRLRRASPVFAARTASKHTVVVFCLGSAASFGARPRSRCARTASTTDRRLRPAPAEA